MTVIFSSKRRRRRTPQAYDGQSPQGPARASADPYILMGPWIASVSGASGTLPSARVLVIIITARCAIPAIAIATRVSGSNGLCSPRGCGRTSSRSTKCSTSSDTVRCCATLMPYGTHIRSPRQRICHRRLLGNAPWRLPAPPTSGHAFATGSCRRPQPTACHALCALLPAPHQHPHCFVLLICWPL